MKIIPDPMLFEKNNIFEDEFKTCRFRLMYRRIHCGTESFGILFFRHLNIRTSIIWYDS